MYEFIRENSCTQKINSENCNFAHQEKSGTKLGTVKY